MFVVIHQWICLNKLYKLIESFFFKFQIIFSNYWLKTEKYIQQITRLGLCKSGVGGICADQQAF